jgi:hypothetical protein
LICRTLQSLVIGAAMLAPGADARAQPPSVDGVEAVYDFYLGGIPAGELTVGAAFSTATYTARAGLRTTGIVGFLYDLAFNARATGRIDRGGLSPDRYNSFSQDPKRQYLVEISFVNRTPVSTRIEPERDNKPWSINPRDQRDTVDPLSGVLAAFAPSPSGSVCEKRVEVFDGRRRFALEIGRRQHDGNRIRCEAEYVRLAGFRPKWMGNNSTRPFTLYMEQRSDGLFHVARAVADTSFGPMILQLRN